MPDEYRDAEHLVPFGCAAVRRTGADVSVVATLTMVHHALAAADALAAEGISVEVIDPRTLVPLRHRNHRRLGAQDRAAAGGRRGLPDVQHPGEIVAAVTEQAFDALKTAPRRLGNPGVPVPFAPPLEDFVLPGRERIAATIRDMLRSR